MTYREIVDRFKTATDNHYMLKDFGYGQLSDIKVHSQEGEADYPYLFLNPGQHTRTGVNMTYNFNMIVMDVATDEDDPHSNFLAIQSDCQQYVDDIIAELYYGYTDKPEIQYDNISYTPFKERFQDSVAGMTATISILVPTPINQCIAPIEKYRNVLQVTDETERTMGPETGDDKVFAYAVDIYNPNGDWQVNRYIVPEAGTYRIEQTQQIKLNTPVGSETIPNQPLIRELTDGPDRDIAATTASGWPTQFETPETVYDFTATWDITIDSITPGGYTWELLTLVDVLGQEESTLQQLPGGMVKIYKLQ